MESLYLVGFAVVAVIAFIFVVILFNFFGLWLRARIANAPVAIGKMIGMRLRRVPVGMIVHHRWRGQGWHRRESESARDGALASRPLCRWRNRGNDHRAGGRRDRQRDRLG